MVGMSQEQSALFWQSLTWKFVLGSGLVKESICHTSPSLLQTLGETCRRVGAAARRTSEATGVARLENAFAVRVAGRVALPRDRGGVSLQAHHRLGIMCLFRRGVTPSEK